MTLADQIQASLTAAMRSQDALRRDTLRMVTAAAYNAEKAARRPLTDDEVVGVLVREVKQRRESVDAYEQAGRDDLAARETAEIAIIAEFLPTPLTDDELRTMVAAAIDETGATSARDLGRVMGVLTPRTRGRADGKVVSGLVAQELARRDLVAHEHGAVELMLAPGVDSTAAFTRRDAIRLAIAAGALVAVLTAILAVDLLPQAAFTGGVGDLAPEAVYAPTRDDVYQPRRDGRRPRRGAPDGRLRVRLFARQRPAVRRAAARRLRPDRGAHRCRVRRGAVGRGAPGSAGDGHRGPDAALHRHAPGARRGRLDGPSAGAGQRARRRAATGGP